MQHTETSAQTLLPDTQELSRRWYLCIQNPTSITLEEQDKILLDTVLLLQRYTASGVAYPAYIARIYRALKEDDPEDMKDEINWSPLQALNDLYLQTIAGPLNVGSDSSVHPVDTMNGGVASSSLLAPQSGPSGATVPPSAPDDSDVANTRRRDPEDLGEERPSKRSRLSPDPRAPVTVVHPTDPPLPSAATSSTHASQPPFPKQTGPPNQVTSSIAGRPLPGQSLSNPRPTSPPAITEDEDDTPPPSRKAKGKAIAGLSKIDPKVTYMEVGTSDSDFINDADGEDDPSETKAMIALKKEFIDAPLGKNKPLKGGDDSTSVPKVNAPPCPRCVALELDCITTKWEQNQKACDGCRTSKNKCIWTAKRREEDLARKAQEKIERMRAKEAAREAKRQQKLEAKRLAQRKPRVPKKLVKAPSEEDEDNDQPGSSKVQAAIKTVQKSTSTAALRQSKLEASVEAQGRLIRLLQETLDQLCRPESTGQQELPTAQQSLSAMEERYSSLHDFVRQLLLHHQMLLGSVNETRILVGLQPLVNHSLSQAIDLFTPGEPLPTLWSSACSPMDVLAAATKVPTPRVDAEPTSSTPLHELPIPQNTDSDPEGSEVYEEFLKGFIREPAHAEELDTGHAISLTSATHSRPEPSPYRQSAPPSGASMSRDSSATIPPTSFVVPPPDKGPSYRNLAKSLFGQKSGPLPFRTVFSGPKSSSLQICTATSSNNLGSLSFTSTPGPSKVWNNVQDKDQKSNARTDGISFPTTWAEYSSYLLPGGAPTSQALSPIQLPLAASKIVSSADAGPAATTSGVRSASPLSSTHSEGQICSDTQALPGQLPTPFSPAAPFHRDQTSDEDTSVSHTPGVFAKRQKDYGTKLKPIQYPTSFQTSDPDNNALKRLVEHAKQHQASGPTPESDQHPTATRPSTHSPPSQANTPLPMTGSQVTTSPDAEASATASGPRSTSPAHPETEAPVHLSPPSRTNTPLPMTGSQVTTPPDAELPMTGSQVTTPPDAEASATALALQSTPPAHPETEAPVHLSPPSQTNAPLPMTGSQVITSLDTEASATASAPRPASPAHPQTEVPVQLLTASRSPTPSFHYQEGDPGNGAIDISGGLVRREHSREDSSEPVAPVHAELEAGIGLVSGGQREGTSQTPQSTNGEPMGSLQKELPGLAASLEQEPGGLSSRASLLASPGPMHPLSDRMDVPSLAPDVSSQSHLIDGSEAALSSPLTDLPPTPEPPRPSTPPRKRRSRSRSRSVDPRCASSSRLLRSSSHLPLVSQMSPIAEKTPRRPRK